MWLWSSAHEVGAAGCLGGCGPGFCIISDARIDPQAFSRNTGVLRQLPSVRVAGTSSPFCFRVVGCGT